MTLPDQIAAYEDCFDLYDAAKNDEKGSRALIGSRGEAKYYAMRMQQARKLQRNESRRMFPKESPAYNKTDYDSLKVTCREDKHGLWWVYVTRHRHDVRIIEQLSEIKDQELVEHARPLLLQNEPKLISQSAPVMAIRRRV